MEQASACRPPGNAGTPAPPRVCLLNCVTAPKYRILRRTTPVLVTRYSLLVTSPSGPGDAQMDAFALAQDAVAVHIAADGLDEGGMAPCQGGDGERHARLRMQLLREDAARQRV